MYRFYFHKNIVLDRAADNFLEKRNKGPEGYYTSVKEHYY